MTETEPYPSGGAVAAHVAELAASLIAAAADHAREEWDAAGAARAQALALGQRAAQLGARDAAAYAAARRALGQRRVGAEPGQAAEGQKAHDQQLGVALQEAAAPPLELAATAADIAELGRVIADRGAGDVRADAVVAAVLAAGAARAAAHLVQVNLIVGGDQQPAMLAQRHAEAAAAAAVAAAEL